MLLRERTSSSSGYGLRILGQMAWFLGVWAKSIKTISEPSLLKVSQGEHRGGWCAQFPE